MFNPYDEQNHAGMLVGMRRSPLLGLAGPTDSRTGTGTARTGTARAGADGRRVGGYSPVAKRFADLPAAKKQAIAKAGGLTYSPQFEADFIDYLEKPFESVNQDYVKWAKQFFVSACAFAADDPVVVEYFNRLTPALAADADAIRADSKAKEADSAVTLAQTKLKAVNKSIGEQQDTLVAASGKLRGAMDYFIDWVQQSMRAIYGQEALFPADVLYAPWFIQQALYGDVPYFSTHGLVHDPQVQQLYMLTYNEMAAFPHFVPNKGLSNLGAAPLSGGLLREDKDKLKKAEYFKNGPALKEIPPVDAYEVNTGAKGLKAWVEVDGDHTYIGYPLSWFSWRFCGKGPTVPTRLRYTGPSATYAYEGFCAAKAWNEEVIPKAITMQAIAAKIVELKAQAAAFTKERDAALAEYTKQSKAAATAQQVFQDKLAQADQFKANLGKGFLLGFADTAAKQLLAAAELDAMTGARSDKLGKVDDLKNQAQTLTDNAAKLIADAAGETDPEKRARMRSDAERRLNRAYGMAERRSGMLDDSNRLGVKRAKSVDDIVREAQRSGIAVWTPSDKKVPGASGLSGSGLVKIPDYSALSKLFGGVAGKVTENAAAIDTLNQTQQQQQQANKEIRQTITDLAEKLPEKYKPEVPPKATPESGGGLGILVAGLVALAAFKKKH